MNKKLVQKQFGANAAQYVTSQVHAKGESLARLLALVAPQKTWKTVDVATGAGHTALAFAPFVAAVTATDITPEMLAKTEALAQERNLTNVTTRYADAEALPFADNTFDCVTCRIAPHHFPDIGKFVQEAARILGAGGVLAVADNVVPAGAAGAYVNQFEKLRDPSHGRCLSVAEWQTHYEQAGFGLQPVEFVDKRLNFDWWARRMTNDDQLVNHLRSLLLDETTAGYQFLAPEESDDGLTFHLQEAILIGRLV